MDILRITARWDGFPGGPGYSNFHFAGGGGLISDASQVAERVRAAFTEIQSWVPSTITITILPTVEVLDSDTGAITAFQEIDDLEPLVMSGPGGYSGPSGAVVNWRTNDVRAGRRIRGRTFLVPLVSSAYENNGTLALNALQDVRAFADAIIGGDLDSEFGVWSRPTGGSGGVFATAVSSTVPDMAAVLRSRRD